MVINHLRPSWDDPPSMTCFTCKTTMVFRRLVKFQIWTCECFTGWNHVTATAATRGWYEPLKSWLVHRDPDITLYYNPHNNRLLESPLCSKLWFWTLLRLIFFSRGWSFRWSVQKLGEITTLRAFIPYLQWRDKAKGVAGKPTRKSPASFRCFLSKHVPGSKLVVLGMVIQPLLGNPYNGYINPYYWVDDHPQLYGNNVSLDPGTHVDFWLVPQMRSKRAPRTTSYNLQ